jgi:four helix bundle protein
MAFKFEKLDVWKMGIEYANEVHLLTRNFPKEEMFSLTSQYKRAADSISLNISEGATGNSTPEFKRFLVFSSRSCAECITCLYHAIARKYINQDEFDNYYQRTEVLFIKINKLKNSIS